MKNHKQALADFYLYLLSIPNKNFAYLKFAVLQELAYELKEDVETVQRIFERMAAEDAQQIKVVCADCNQEWPDGVEHKCR